MTWWSDEEADKIKMCGCDCDGGRTGRGWQTPTHFTVDHSGPAASRQQCHHTWRPTNTNMVRIFTEKASCCCSLTTAVNVFLLLSLLLRVAGLTCGCFYGPYLYLVVSVGGLYVAGESWHSQEVTMILYFQLTVFSSGLSTGEHRRENSYATSPARKSGFLSGKLATSWQSLGFLLLLVSHTYWSHHLHLDGLIVLRLVSRQSGLVVDALHSNPLRGVPDHLFPPALSPLLCLPPPDSLPGAGWGLHRCESDLPSPSL